MSDTKVLLERVKELHGLNAYQLRTLELVKEHLLDASPLSREELESVLKGAGFASPRPFHCEVVDLANYDLGVDIAFLEDGTVYITGLKPGNNRTLFQGNAKLLTRQLLKACGVIK